MTYYILDRYHKRIIKYLNRTIKYQDRTTKYLDKINMEKDYKSQRDKYFKGLIQTALKCLVLKEILTVFISDSF